MRCCRVDTVFNRGCWSNAVGLTPCLAGIMLRVVVGLYRIHGLRRLVETVVRIACRTSTPHPSWSPSSALTCCACVVRGNQPFREPSIVVYFQAVTKRIYRVWFCLFRIGSVAQQYVLYRIDCVLITSEMILHGRKSVHAT